MIIRHTAFDWFKQKLNEGQNTIYPLLIGATSDDQLAMALESPIIIELTNQNIYLLSKSHIAIESTIIDANVHSKLPIDAQIIAENGNIYFEKLLPKVIRKKLKKVEELEKTCPICLTCIADSYIVIDCSHQFCERCIVNWYKQSSKCPLCKKPYCLLYTSPSPRDS